jgi:hypothetical protein
MPASQLYARSKPRLITQSYGRRAPRVSSGCFSCLKRQGVHARRENMGQPRTLCSTTSSGRSARIPQPRVAGRPTDRRPSRGRSAARPTSIPDQILSAANAEQNIGCHGDSGAPIINSNSQLVAVQSTAYPGDCNAVRPLRREWGRRVQRERHEHRTNRVEPSASHGTLETPTVPSSNRVCQRRGIATVRRFRG